MDSPAPDWGAQQLDRFPSGAASGDLLVFPTFLANSRKSCSPCFFGQAGNACFPKVFEAFWAAVFFWPDLLYMVPKTPALFMLYEPLFVRTDKKNFYGQKNLPADTAF